MSFFNKELQEEMQLKLLRAMNNGDSYTIEDYTQEFSNPDLISYNDLSNEYKIDLKFKNDSNNPNPEYATAGSSGFDLRANLIESLVIKSGEYILIKTGLYFDIPDNMEITIRSRSGLAYKHGVCVLNGIGTIDSDYTGEIGVLLINHGKEDFIISNGDRIAQGVLSSVINKNLTNLIKCDEIIKKTNRGDGGYGSTGSK
jgi:dUTP pyrophosphatase